MRTLLNDPLLTLTIDDARRLVCYRRTREPFTTLEEMRALHERMLQKAKGLAFGRLKLLVDVREAPPRNDAAFEKEVSQQLGIFISKFSVHAVVVRSAAGSLQVRRLERERSAGAEAPVFSNEADALRHLGL